MQAKRLKSDFKRLDFCVLAAQKASDLCHNKGKK